MSHGIRPSKTLSTKALWAKSLLNAVLFFGVFMIAIPMLMVRLLPAPLHVPERLSVVAGAALFAAGIALWAICLDHFSRRGRGTPFPLDAPRELVTTGPFALVRNPIMAAELAVIWGEALYFDAFAIALYALVATLAGHVLVTNVEEPELLERFGADYETYRRRVPRWFPTRERGGAPTVERGALPKYRGSGLFSRRGLCLKSRGRSIPLSPGNEMKTLRQKRD